MSIAGAADVLGVHAHTIRRWIASGTLPAVRVGPRLYRIHTNDVARIGRPVLPAATRKAGVR